VYTMKKTMILQSIAHALELRNREMDEAQMSQIARSPSKANLVYQREAEIA
jgi:hypothetical protein